MTTVQRTASEQNGPGDLRRWGLILSLAVIEITGCWFLLRHPVGVACLALVVLATAVSILRPSLGHTAAVLGLAVLVAGVWTVALYRGFNGDTTGVGFIRWFDGETTISSMQSDPELYRAYVKDSAGHGYYRTASDVLSYANAVRAGKVDTGSRTAFRQPLLYVALGKVPTGFGVVSSALVLATLAIGAAFWLGLTFGTPAIALGCAAALAGHLAATASAPAVLDTETWAGMLVIVSVALAASCVRSGRSALALHSIAAFVALLAASIRELSAPLLVLGLFVALVDSGLRRRRVWVPWAIGLLTFGIVYAVHLRTVAAYITPVPGMVTGFATWFYPDGSGLAGTVAVIRSASGVAGLFAWALFIAGVAGALIAPHDRTRRLLLGGVAVGGTLLLLVLRSPATDALTGEAMNTWGALITPVVLACVPLALTRLIRPFTV